MEQTREMLPSIEAGRVVKEEKEERMKGRGRQVPWWEFVDTLS